MPSPNGFWMVFGCFSVARSGPKSEKIREKVQLCFDVEQKTVLIGLGPGKSLFLMQPSIGERYFCTVRNFLGFCVEKVGFGMPKGSHIKVRGIIKTGPETNVFHSQVKVGAEELSDVWHGVVRLGVNPQEKEYSLILRSPDTCTVHRWRTVYPRRSRKVTP